VPFFIEANFADPSLPFFDQASMATGVALQCVAGKLFGQLAGTFDGHIVKNIGEWSCSGTYGHYF
jgi:hypothetical protein